MAGECGARSIHRLDATPGPQSTAGRSMVLKLRSRSFTAAPGHPVRLRYRLSRRGMTALRKARLVRMRGRLVSRDRLGNRTDATFRFRLKARTRRGRVSGSAALSW